jgi:two-component sensor histidine kinase
MDSRFCNVAKVKTADNASVMLPVTSADKPDVPPLVLDKWQNLADLAAKSIGTDAGLIMRLSPEQIEVCVSSAGPDNPYAPMETSPLGLGLYCETVVGTRNVLNIPNALADKDWKDNPDIALGMISYLGMPLKWPDGELFGTICVLDRKEHPFAEVHIDILAHLRMAIETDLHMLCERQRMEQLVREKDIILQEAHHRIKNHLHMLSGMVQLGIYAGVETKQDMDTLLHKLTERIRAIALLHSHIAMAADSQVALDDFVETIATTIIDALADREVDLNLDVDPVSVNRRTFFHLGLLISELITNALKHAFAATASPTINVTMKNIDTNTFSLQVCDNGSGLTPGFSPKAQDSIGMMLISDLPGQMGGSYTVSSDKGTCFDFILGKRSGDPEPPMPKPASDESAT